MRAPMACVADDARLDGLLADALLDAPSACPPRGAVGMHASMVSSARIPRRALLAAHGGGLELAAGSRLTVNLNSMVSLSQGYAQRTQRTRRMDDWLTLWP